MDKNFQEQLRTYLEQAKLNVNILSTCSVDNDLVDTSNKTLIDSNSEKSFKSGFEELSYQEFKTKIDTLIIQNNGLRDDNTLRKCFAGFVGILLAVQTIAIFIFLFVHHHLFHDNSLTLILLTIAGQSYFLPSFLAKHLFKNDGVKIK